MEEKKSLRIQCLRNQCIHIPAFDICPTDDVLAKEGCCRLCRRSCQHLIYDHDHSKEKDHASED